MRETLCRAGKVAWTGQRHACRHSLRLFPIRDIRAIRGQVNHRKSGTWWNRSLPNPSSPLAPKTSWDETSQPLPAASITSGLETSRLQTSRAFATQNFLGRDVPAPIQTLNYFRVGDIPSPHLPRPRTQNFLGRDVPAPTRTINYLGVGDVPSPKLPCPHNARHQFGTSPAHSPTRLQNPERVSDSSRG